MIDVSYPSGDRRYPPDHPLSPEKVIASYRNGKAIPKSPVHEEDRRMRVNAESDAKLMAGILEQLDTSVAIIADGLEDEGDRVYLGSTNHADVLKDLREQLEQAYFENDEEFKRIQGYPDLYKDLRELREKVEEQEAQLQQYRCGEAAVQIGEHAFRAGWIAYREWAGLLANLPLELGPELCAAWSEYDPPEELKGIGL